MKEIKKKNRDVFAYTWPLYLLAPVVIGLTVSYLFYVLHRPAANETITLFVASLSITSKEVEDPLEKQLAKEGLKEADIVFSNPKDSTFSTKLSVVGYSGSDLFLLPKSVLSSISCSSALLPLSDNIISKYVKNSSPSFFSQDDEDKKSQRYGLFIDKEKVWYHSSLSFLDDDYYLCLNSGSKNIGSEGLYDLPEDDLGLKAFSLLQEETL